MEQAKSERETLEELMARDGRVYIVRDRAQLATAIAKLTALIASIEKFKSRHSLPRDEATRYTTAVQLLQARIQRAEAIDVRLLKRAEI